MARQDGVALEDRWFIRFRGIVEGPFAVEELQARAKRGKFTRIYEVSPDGTTWSAASKHPELFPAAAAPPRVPRQSGDAPSPGAAAPAGSPPAAPPDLNEYRLSDSAPVEPLLLEPNPLAPSTETAGDAKSWYYTRGTEEHGPVSLRDLRMLASLGQLSPGDYVWKDGMRDWVQASWMPGVFPASGAGAGPAIASGPAAPSGPDSGRASPLAIASFALGLAGTTILFFVGSVAAVVLGHVALGHFGRAGPVRQGRGLALAGLILGYAVVVIGTLTGFVLLLVYLLKRA